jgi:hypothetical protein
MMRRRAWLRHRSGNGIAGRVVVVAAADGVAVAVVAVAVDIMAAAAVDTEEDGDEVGSSCWLLASG